MCVLKKVYKRVGMHVCVYSVQRKCTVGAEMPACPEILRSKAGKEGGKETPARRTRGLVSCPHSGPWWVASENSTFQLLIILSL